MLPLNQSKSDDLDLGVMTFHASRSCTERSIIVARHFFSLNLSSPSRISIAAQRPDHSCKALILNKKKERDLQHPASKLRVGNLVSTTSTTGCSLQVERKKTDGVREHVLICIHHTRLAVGLFLLEPDELCPYRVQWHQKANFCCA